MTFLVAFVSRRRILQRMISIHFSFCQITSPLYQYNPSELFKKRQFGVCVCVYCEFMICVYSKAVMQYHSCESIYGGNDYPGKNRTLMKIIPLQFVPHRPAVGVLVYG